jgi:Spy/CpxP family protein refolding chaperone
MKKGKFSIYSAVIIISLLFSTISMNYSYGQCANKKEDVKTCKKGNHSDKSGPFNFIPNLTDDQKSKIKDLHLNLKKETILLKNQIGEKEAHLKTITMVDKVDMSEVNKTIDESFALKASLAKKKATFHQEVRALLNNEQKVVFDSKASCGKHKGNGKMNGKKGCCEDGQKNGKNCNKDAGNNDSPAGTK